MRPTATTRPDITTAEPSAATCACTVSLHEISFAAGRSGQLDDVVMRHVVELGIPVGQDWRGEPAVFVGDAGRLHDAIAGFMADHDARWREYQRYLEAEQVKALEARTAAARKARAEAEEESRRVSDAHRKAWEEQTARDLAEQERQRRERQGAPIPFEKFKAEKAS